MTFNDQLTWLIQMAKMPGAKDHAWRRAKELATDDSGLWPEIDKRLAEAMQSASPSPSAPSADSTPASTGGQGRGA